MIKEREQEKENKIRGNDYQGYKLEGKDATHIQLVLKERLTNSPNLDLIM